MKRRQHSAVYFKPKDSWINEDVLSSIIGSRYNLDLTCGFGSGFQHDCCCHQNGQAPTVLLKTTTTHLGLVLLHSHSRAGAALPGNHQCQRERTLDCIINVLAHLL